MKKIVLGSGRVVYSPSPSVRDGLDRVIEDICSMERRAAKHAGTSEVAHCLRGRSPVTCATAHIGYDWSIGVDLADCFGSIGKLLIPWRSRPGWEVCFDPAIPGVPQGYSTSPGLCNLALVGLDRSVLRIVRGWGVYTRYVDDLTISGPSSVDPRQVLVAVRGAIRRFGLRESVRKTRIQDARYGNRVIVGVSVGDVGISVPRSVRRRIRALRWRSGVWDRRYRGLVEWSKLRPPRSRVEARAGRVWPGRVLEARELARHWKLRISRTGWERIASRDPVNLQLWPGPVRDATYPCEGVVITNDPCLMLGPSNWGGFTSCYRQPDGRYRRCTPWLAGLEGCYIVAEVGGGDRVIDGISRPHVRGRCWVYATLDGSWVRSRRIYGSQDRIREVLDSLDCPPCHRREVVIGKAGRAPRSWWDDLIVREGRFWIK